MNKPNFDIQEPKPKYTGNSFNQLLGEFKSYLELAFAMIITQFKGETNSVELNKNSKLYNFYVENLPFIVLISFILVILVVYYLLQSLKKLIKNKSKGKIYLISRRERGRKQHKPLQYD